MMDYLLMLGYGLGLLFLLVSFVLPVTLIVGVWVTDKVKARRRSKQVKGDYLEKRMMTPRDGVYISRNVFPRRPCRSCTRKAEEDLDDHFDSVAELFSESK